MVRTIATAFLLIISVSFTLPPLKAQQTGSAFNPENLEVSWELIENFYQDQVQYLSALTLTNNGNVPVPSGGWSIYFNQFGNVDSGSVTGNATIELINGGLFRLSPAPGFTRLNPGQSLRIEFVSGGAVLNKSLAPRGLYWVWNSNPDHGISFKNYSIKPVSDNSILMRHPSDQVPVATPDVIYNKNKTIRDIPSGELTKVFPTPLEYRETEGEFVLNTETVIQPESGLEQEARYLAEELEKIFGVRPEVAATRQPGNVIWLTGGEGAPESYRLSVTADEIAISGADAAGVFYGIQTLKTLLHPSSWLAERELVTVPGVEIRDAPRFAHRAFMLDVARNFSTKEEIKKILDLMSLYKLNVFHLHFNDDEGWRIEIPGLPELTEIGARRGHTLEEHEKMIPSFGSGPVTDFPGSGYYTTEDFIEILEYATERHIEIIPEIETPGHARAAIKSMDARYRRLMNQGNEKAARQYLLRDLEDESEYRSVQGWDDNVINVALPSAYRFLEKVIDELAAMYEKAGASLNTIHMGGDEVPSGVWEKSPAVQQFMKDNPELNRIPDLWYYFYGRVHELLRERSIQMYGWEEVGMEQAFWQAGGGHQSGPTPEFADQNVILDVWNNVIGSGAEDLAYRLANAGYKVVLSGVSNFYFDMAYYKAFPEPGLYWSNFLDVDKPFSFIPYNLFKNANVDMFGRKRPPSYFEDMVHLTEKGKANIMGLQGLLWAENLVNADRLEYMMLPKLLGLAERAWAPAPAWASEEDTAQYRQRYKEAWSRFINKVSKSELPRLDHYHSGYDYRIPTVGAVVKDSAVVTNIQMPGFTVRYTVNGSEPSVESKKYKGPITDKGTIKLRVFNRNGRGGRTVEINNE